VDTTAEETPSERQNVVTFRLDKQTYALPIDSIAQIVEMVAITPIPQLDAVVEGVINLHGEAVAVVKLRRHFGLSDAPLQLNTPILLTRICEQTIGLIVDEVTDVLNLPSGQVVPLSEILPEELESAPIFRGLTYVADDTVLMLAPDQIFRPDQLEILAQAARLLQEAIAKKGRAMSEAEPGAEPGAESKPTRRRRKATSKKKITPEEKAVEPEPKKTRGRRTRKSTGGNA
jgi:purine-binding chemotaxis protein CheW